MNINPRFKYPPPISKTLGFDLIDCSERTATIEIVTDVAEHANPMGKRFTVAFSAMSRTPRLERRTRWV